MTRYFLSRDKLTKFIGVFDVHEIAALLNAKKIREDYIVIECNSGGAAVRTPKQTSAGNECNASGKLSKGSATAMITGANC
jgi:hypothetical protein